MSAKVLFVSHSGAVSGAERVLLDLVRAFPGSRAFVFEPGHLPDMLAKAGLDVQVSAHGMALQGARRDAGMAVILPMLSAVLRIVGEIYSASRDAGLVYANSQKAFTLAALASAFRRRKLIWHLHDILSPAHFGRMQRRIQTRLANWFAHRVIVPSRAAAEAFVAAGGNPDLVAVVPNGIDRGIDSRDKDTLRDVLGLQKGRILAGVFSRLSPWKGQDVVIRALAGVPDVTAVLAGAALFGEDDYVAGLHRLVQELGLQDRVIFLGQRSDVQLLMQAMDFVIHPSTDPEPFGLTLVEAMLAGVPLLASNAGASADITENGRFGTLFAPGDAEALAHAMRQELDHLTRETGAASGRLEAARNHAHDVYSVERMNAAVTAIVESVMRGK